tara:strand:+ start:237 stop:599 length:363 start_codon:yes stop_codon:yes gene_type:complete
MSWRPAIGLHHPTTTEKLSGRTVDGDDTYIKLIKKAGAAGTGNVDIAHGVVGMVRLLSIYGGCNNADGRKMPLPYSASASSNYISLRNMGTANNIRVSVSSSWAGADALEDIWLVIEYKK